MAFLPVMLRLDDLPILMVGGGAVATRKVAKLVDHGAMVRVVARSIAPGLSALARRHERVECHARAFRPSDIEGVGAVFCATGDEVFEAGLSRLAVERGLLFNSADDVSKSSILLSTTCDRGPLRVAVSTGGASPALAVRVRDEIESLLGPEYEEAAILLGRLRLELEGVGNRSEILERLLDGGLLEALRRGDEPRVARLVDEARAAGGRRAVGGGAG